MKTAIIYHQIKAGVNCPDGIAAAWVAAKVYPDAEIIGCCYGDIPEIKDAENLVVVDFSFHPETLSRWAKECRQVTLIDHHLSAWESLKYLQGQINPSINFEMSECGATFAWKHFFPSRPIPAFLEYVRDQDLWDWLLPHSEEVNTAMAELGRSFELFDQLEGMSQEQLLEYLMPIGQPLIEPKKKKVEEIASRWQWERIGGYPIPTFLIKLFRLPKTWQQIGGYRVPVVRLAEDGSEDRLTSWVCMKLYREMDVPFVACLTSAGEMSLRSNKHDSDFDVSKVAVKMGGGGHRNAAGYKVKD